MSKQTGFPEQGPLPRELESFSDRLSKVGGLKMAVSPVDRQLDWISYGNDAAKPTAGYAGRIYIATDTTPKKIYLDNGTSWIQIVG